MTGLFAQQSDPSAILSFDAEQADCAAEAVVGALGVERLVELGMDPATGEPPTPTACAALWGAFRGQVEAGRL